MSSSRIKELPQEDRPREKLAKIGAQALSDAELIAILLGTGRIGTNVIDLARQLIREHHTLQALARCSVAELSQIKGVGPAKACQLAAAFGLGQRLTRESIVRAPMDAPEQVCAVLADEMRTLHRESLRILLLDTKLRLMRIEEVSLGSLNESLAHPREVFRPAIIHAAYAVVLAHNHPSGDPTPSEADHRLTRRLAEGAKLLQIVLLDHIIIGAPSEGRATYFSFREAGIV